MKKIQSLFYALIITLALLMPCFCASQKTNTTEIAFANVEDSYYDNDAIDLISRNPSGNIMNGIVEDIAPFNTDTYQKMEGKSITPSSDDYGQINAKNFKITQYQPSEGDVVYLWVYLIDVFSFELKISLSDSLSNTVSWEFDSMDLYEFGTGWKLLALKLSDFDSEVSYTEHTYEYINFSYKSEDDGFSDGEKYEDYAEKTTEKFSFYHVFVADVVDAEKSSGIVAELSNSYYKLSESFPFNGTVFVGDKIKIQKPAEIFEYLYIGKYDLSNYTTSGKYYWSLKIQSPSKVTTNVDFGDMILFNELGFYNLTIQLVEVGTFKNVVRLNKDISIFCDEAHFGTFNMGLNYKIKDNEKLLITFILTDNFVTAEDYEVSLDNKNAEIESYYEKDGVLYICVAGRSGGVCKLNISAKGSTRYNDSNMEMLSSATINIESTEKQTDIFLVILWIVFACFCLGIVIYLIISLVKARRNDVK